MTDRDQATEGADARTADRVDRHLGARVRDRRRELGVSQVKLADTLGVSFQQIQKYEIGTNRISASKLWRIGQVLGVEPGYWFDGLPADDHEAARYDTAAELLLTDDGQALARAYAAIGDRDARLALIAIAQALANRHHAADHSGADDDARAVAPGASR